MQGSQTEASARRVDRIQRVDVEGEVRRRGLPHHLELYPSCGISELYAGCHFAVQLDRFIPGSLSYPVAYFVQ